MMVKQDCQGIVDWMEHRAKADILDCPGTLEKTDIPVAMERQGFQDSQGGQG